MRPVVRLVRLGNVVVTFTGTGVGGLAAFGHGLGLSWEAAGVLCLAALSAAMVTAGGNVLNDILDREGDRKNHPERPLVTGEISVSSARTLSAGLLLGSVVVVAPAVPGHWGLLLILASALVAVLGYEFRFKSAGLSGNALVAYLTAAVFLYGGAAESAPWSMVPFAAMAFFATLSREVIKDMEDAAGDVDRRTLPRVHGFRVSGAVARGCVAAAIVLSFLPFVLFVPLGSAAGIMYLALVLAADGLFVASVAPLPDRLHWAQSVSKVAMAVALLAFLATAFR